jgi:hypothetical protein
MAAFPATALCSSIGRVGSRARRALNDQIVELQSPGLQILFFSPSALSALEDGKSYAARFPDGADLVDTTNAGTVAAVGLRWPARDYWLHLSGSMDHRIVARASDHVRLGLRVEAKQLCVRGGDDLFEWRRRCPDEQLVTIADGHYEITACMVPPSDDGPVRIYLHFVRVIALPDLGYESVPELYCE